MPRKRTSLFLTVAGWSIAIALVALAISATTVSSLAAPESPSGLFVIEVNYSHDWINVTTIPMAHVQITLKRDGLVIATMTGQADGGGNFQSEQGSWSPSRPDILPGDSVEATSPGSSSVVDPIGEIAGTLDMNTDTISGAIHAPWLAPANLTVRCESWVEGSTVPPIVVTNVPAAGGSYTCDFGTLGQDIAPGYNFAVRYFAPDGNQVIRVFRAPAPELAVDMWPEGSGKARAGGLAVFHVNYRNEADTPAQNVVLTNTLPAGTSFVTSTLGVAPVIAAGRVTWSIGTVEPGAPTHFFVVLANTLAPGATIQNVMDIGTSSPGDEPGNNHREATVEIISDAPDVNVGIQAHPHNPFPGDTYRIAVDYGNNSPAPGGPVRLHVQLAPDTTLQTWSSENGYGPLWRLVSSAGGHLIFEAPALPGGWGDRLLLTVAVMPTVPAQTQLTSTVSIEEPADFNLDNNGPFSQEVWTSDSGIPDLRVEKMWGHGQLTPGGHAFFHINYSNDGNLTQHGVRLTDTLPTGATFIASMVNLNWGDSYPVSPVYKSDGIVAWDLGTLQPGHLGELRVELMLGDTPAGTTITNTADIRAMDRDRSWWNNHSEAIEHVNGPGANLRLSKASYWEWPGQVRFELIFENVGTTVVENVRITDILPSGLVFNGDWWANWPREMNMDFNPVTREIMWTTSRLEPYGSGSINFRADVPGPQIGQQGLIFTNIAQITLPQGELTPSDNTTTAVAFTGPDLYINKSLWAGEIVPGGVVTFTVDLGNQNNGPWSTGNPPQDSPSIYITDTLPAGMSFLYASEPGRPGHTFQPWRQAGNILTWIGGGLCAGCREQFQITARISDTVPGLTALTNTIEIADAVPGDVDPYPDNNLASWSGTVLPTYAVRLEPATRTASGLPGAVVTHSLRLTNAGNAPAIFDLGYDGHTWNVVVDQTQFALAPGAFVDVPVRVTIPSLAGLTKLQDSVTITATIRADTTKRVSSVLTTNAGIVRVYLPLLRRP